MWRKANTFHCKPVAWQLVYGTQTHQVPHAHLGLVSSLQWAGKEIVAGKEIGTGKEIGAGRAGKEIGAGKTGR